MSGPVAITGATGFIGSALLRSLTFDRANMTFGHAVVRALTRRARPAMPGVEWIHGDLGDRAALARLVAGASAVLHCAGAVRGLSAQQFETDNVAGTDALASAAAALDPAPRFLFLSSLAAREPELSWYAQSKRRAEQMLERQAPRLPCTIFRPSAVYGPGDREIRPLLTLMRSAGILPLVGKPDHRFSLLHISDLIAAVRAWLSATRPAAGIFTICDGTERGYSWNDVRDTAASVFGHPVRTVPIPGPILYFVSRTNLVFSRLTRRRPMLTPGKARELTHPDWVCDNADICKQFNWRPRLELREALTRFAADRFRGA
jgi:nucleoside-diphosphate-sugar epimerase